MHIILGMEKRGSRNYGTRSAWVLTKDNSIKIKVLVAKVSRKSSNQYHRLKSTKIRNLLKAQNNIIFTRHQNLVKHPSTYLIYVLCTSPRKAAGIIATQNIQRRVIWICTSWTNHSHKHILLFFT